jgi:hypothetical protein
MVLIYVRKVVAKLKRSCQIARQMALQRITNNLPEETLVTFDNGFIILKVNIMCQQGKKAKKIAPFSNLFILANNFRALKSF